MHKLRLRFMVSAVLLLWTIAGHAQFDWQQSSIGGGGFCMEIRFDPYSAANPPPLYLATDVAGLYYSSNLGETSWQPIWDVANNPDLRTRYVTSKAFNQDNGNLVVATKEGIYYGPADGSNWQLANMPDRSWVEAQTALPAMRDDDGRYPWVGIIRECPFNGQYFLAGLGDVRGKPNKDGETTLFGMTSLLRSTNGGQDWDWLQIGAGASGTDHPNLIIYDIDYVRDDQGMIHTFVSTGHSEKITATTYDYFGGIYYSSDVFTASSPMWRKISNQAYSSPMLRNTTGTVILTDDPQNDNVSRGDDVRIYTTRLLFYNDPTIVPGGAYYTETTLIHVLTTPTPLLNFNWICKRQGLRFGQLVAKPNSTISEYEIYTGKKYGLQIDLRLLHQGVTKFKRIVEPPDTETGHGHDNGYRNLQFDDIKDKWNTDLKFGSIDIRPDVSSQDLPVIYGCWDYGPVKAPPIAGGNQNSQRNFEQLFTNGSGGLFSGHGVDELFFNGSNVAFHPQYASGGSNKVILIGVTDNGVMRSTDDGASWTARRIVEVQSWFGGAQQHVYHVRFHPFVNNLVVASAGVTNHGHKTPGTKGGLFLNNMAGAGDESDWTIIGGKSDDGMSDTNLLPSGEIHAFAFDRSAYANQKIGMIVAMRNHGLYYGWLKDDGTLDDDFVKIVDSDLTAKIPIGSSSPRQQHYYSCLEFDGDNTLYLARHFPAGGVFRMTLDDRSQVGQAQGNFITAVDEVITGAYDATPTERRPINNASASEVINLLVTPADVFAGVTPGHDPDKDGTNYSGGLIRWDKTGNPGVYEWEIGGPVAEPNGQTDKRIAIGGIARDPVNTDEIYAVTYRFSVRNDRDMVNGVPERYWGEDNYRVMDIWHSTNSGYDFAPQATGHGFPDAVTMAFIPDNAKDKIVMPTHGNGVWLGTRQGAASKQAANPESTSTAINAPKVFELYANYPNPFNPQTTIAYDLPKESYVRIEIFNALGHRIKVLRDHRQEAGNHRVSWHGEDELSQQVSSGLYFYRLQAGHFSAIRKMILLQ